MPTIIEELNSIIRAVEVVESQTISKKRLEIRLKRLRTMIYERIGRVE